MISAIKKFKEENEIPVEDEPALSADDTSVTDFSDSKLRDLIKQEMASMKPSNDTQSDTTTHNPNLSKTIDDPLPKDHSRDRKPKEFSRPVEPPKNKLPKKSKNSSHSVRRRPTRPLYMSQKNTELQPINIRSLINSISSLSRSFVKLSKASSLVGRFQRIWSLTER